MINTSCIIYIWQGSLNMHRQSAFQVPLFASLLSACWNYSPCEVWLFTALLFHTAPSMCDRSPSCIFFLLTPLPPEQLDCLETLFFFFLRHNQNLGKKTTKTSGEVCSGGFILQACWLIWRHLWLVVVATLAGVAHCNYTQTLRMHV